MGRFIVKRKGAGPATWEYLASRGGPIRWSESMDEAQLWSEDDARLLAKLLGAEILKWEPQREDYMIRSPLEWKKPATGKLELAPWQPRKHWQR